MDLQLQLFVRRHRTGFVTAQLVGDDSVVVYAPSVEEALEELELAISDRVERTHPRLQSSFSAPMRYERVSLEVEDLVPVYEGGRKLEPTDVSVLVADNRGWRTVYVPRFDLHYFVSTKGVDWKVAVRELLAEHLEAMSDAERLALRFELRETLEPLHIDARPPPLSAFAGKRRMLRVLPLAAEEAEHEEAEEEAAAKAKAGDKKVPTPTLEKIGVPMSRLAEEGQLGRAVARDDEVGALLRMLSRAEHTCVAVVGPSGVGKSAVLDELVHRIRAEDTQDKLRKRPVWFVDASRLVAGQGFFGDWQRQTFDVLEEVEASRAIWYIGALLPLLDAGKHVGSDLNVSQLLKPYLAGRRVTVVAEASEREWAQLEARDTGFARLFVPYRLEEPEPARALAILEGIGARALAEEGVTVGQGALEAVQELCRRYADGSLLGAAAQLLRRAVESAAATGRSALDRHLVVSHFSKETGLPEHLLRDDVALDPEAVEAAFRRRLVGQDEAVRRMTDLVAVIKGGLSDLSRPLGGFLFVGPTGVGKTETAKALAAYLFGSERRLLRFDMSEYVGPDAIHRFLGTEAEEGKLVEGVRKQPFSVVLLDEIEKADDAIFDVLLQVLGEARLTDEAGRTADFKNAVVILTSNLGVESFRASMGIDATPSAEAYHAHFIKEAERFFRPELFNRLDHVVSFLPLQAEAIARITTRELDKLVTREGLRARGIGLEIDGEVQDWLAARGVDPRYGARPLKRVIERSLAMPLAKHLARHREDRAVRVRVDGDALAFTRMDAARSESTHRAKAKIEQTLTEVDGLRFRLSRWMQSAAYREMDHQLRLLDQLSKNRHFWKNRDKASARTEKMQLQLGLRTLFEENKRLLDGLEDVAFEALSDLDEAPVHMVDAELVAARSKLAEAELALFAARFSRPDEAMLYFRAHEGSDAFLVDLLETYVQLGLQLGWTLDLFEAVEIETEAVLEPPPKPPPKRGKAAKKAEAEGAPPVHEPKRQKRRGPRRFEWRRFEVTFDAAWAEAAAEANSAGEPVRRALRRATGSRPLDFYALAVRGPFARAWLAFEDGIHARQDHERREVRVCVTERPSAPAHPVDLPWKVQLRRLEHQGRRVVLDPVLGTHVALAHLAGPYRKLMRTALYVAVFGERGLEWAKRWGHDD